MAAPDADSWPFVSVAMKFGATRKRCGSRDRAAQRAENALVREELLLRIPFDWEISVVLQALGRKAHGLSSHADRFNYCRRQESQWNHMAHVAIAQAFPVRDLFG